MAIHNYVSIMTQIKTTHETIVGDIDTSQSENDKYKHERGNENDTPINGTI